MKKILLCSDLDRTLIPNGEQAESSQARELFALLAARLEIRLAYVSGRHAQLVKEAIAEYALPMPDFVIGDVGTTLYRIEREATCEKEGKQWRLDKKWQQEIGRDWHNCNRDDVVRLVAGIDSMNLQLQEDAKQNDYKVSYYTDLDLDLTSVQNEVAVLLDAQGIRSTVIWSRDDAAQCGLLDILPRRANKLQAMRFLMQEENIPETNTVFAGDSGNDLDALTSGLQAILVRNSAADVRKMALAELAEKRRTDCLYIAKGGLHGMNGNYAAGVLEGVVHFFPETADWLFTKR
jgi:sucrose-6F-phosphate phosphohydrolase